MLVSWSQLGFNQATSTALLKDAYQGVSFSLMMNELNAGMEEWVSHTLVWPARPIPLPPLGLAGQTRVYRRLPS